VQHTIDGTLYAVQGYVNLLGLWCNVDQLTELGLEPPTTLEELEAAMAAAQEIGLAGITLSGLPQSQGEWQAYPWLSSHGFTYESPQEQPLTEAFAWVHAWVSRAGCRKKRPPGTRPCRSSSSWPVNRSSPPTATGRSPQRRPTRASSTPSCPFPSARPGRSTSAARDRLSERSRRIPSWPGSTSPRPTTARRARSPRSNPSAPSRPVRTRTRIPR